MQQLQYHTCTIVTNQSPEMAEFGISEIISLFDLYGMPHDELFKYNFPDGQVPPIKDINSSSFPTFPFIDVRIYDLDIIQKVMNRAILIHDILFTLARAETLEQLKDNILPQGKDYLQDVNLSCKIDVITSYFKITQKKKVELIDQVFTAMDSKNQVNLKEPDILYYIIMPKENNHFAVGYTFQKKKKKRDTKYAHQFVLPNRIYLGPVALAHDIAFIMANQAQLKENDIVLDPFSGTGSALVACSYFGAICFGAEIDGYVQFKTNQLLQGHSIGYINKESTFYSKEILKKPYCLLNFKQYNLPEPQLIQTDVNHRNYSKTAEGFFDAIVCDPPYGIRASIQQDVNEKDKSVNRTAIYKQMFNIARRLLRKGGRLVYLYPIWKATYQTIEEEQGFELIDYREQKMADKRSRLLVTMKKK